MQKDLLMRIVSCTQPASGTGDTFNEVFACGNEKIKRLRRARSEGISDTRTGLALTPPLRLHPLGMPQANNAGIRRNRRPAGVKVVERKIVLTAETDARLKAAGMASGSLSLSLYLERLVSQLEAERGTLPVLSPTL